MSLLKVEPAAVAEAVRVVLVALVALGWVALDDVTVAAIVSAVSAILSVGLTVWTRSRVTPLPED